jgi:Mg2+-importing ATPase
MQTIAKIKPIKEYAQIPPEKLFKLFRTEKHGLTDGEAMKRSKIYGLNEVAKRKKINPILKFLSYFKDPLIIILLVAASISALTSQFRNSIIIILMIFVSTVLNFYQEHRSSKAAEKIAKKLMVRATALRNGKKKEMLTRYLVPGDIVLLAAGDIVPADGRLIESDDFFINEAVLTGESFPIEKSVADKNHDIIYSGTNVVSGYARCLVTHTGLGTEYGKIADTLIAPEETNSFEIGIKSFGILIVKAIVAVVLIVFLVNAFKHKDLVDSLIFSLAIAVGITPELLPMIMSINMAKGSVKMAKKGVIVKRLNAIPDFGSMDVLCTDKTGTLTEDKITLVKHTDVFGRESTVVLRLAYTNGYFETGIKSILDKAILDFKDIDVSGQTKVDEIPYDFARKRSSIIYEEAGERKMVTKGAPEEIFKICSHYADGEHVKPVTTELAAQFEKLYEDYSSQGLRVLAIGVKKLAVAKKIHDKKEEKDMTLAGFVSFFDPPKKSAKETLDFMKEHGVEVKILTGDSALVTKKICDDLGIEIKGIVTGDEIDINTMSEEVIAVKAMNANILARMSPSQKDKIITSLKHKGLVVGYMGDGINDAPSLRNADVGISVDNAVDVAKETADIILMEKSLGVLMDGVIEGRKTFGNTMKYMMMGLSSNFGNMFSMIGAALYLPFFPMTAGQILLNNFTYDISQLAIPADTVDKEYLAKPKHWDMKFIRNFMLAFGPISSIFDFLTFFLLYSVFGLSNSAFQTGWFIESWITQTFVIFIIRTRKLPFIESRPSKYLVYSILAIFLVNLIIIYSSIGKFFGFTPLPLAVLLAIFCLVIIYLLMVEAVKQFFYKKIYPGGQK